MPRHQKHKLVKILLSLLFFFGITVVAVSFMYRDATLKKSLKLFNASIYYGASLEVSGKHDEAVAVYREAIERIQKAGAPKLWADMHVFLRRAADTWAKRSMGDDIQQRGDETIQVYRTVLTVCTREAFPQEWSMMQHHLGNALQRQAEASEGATGARVRRASSSIGPLTIWSCSVLSRMRGSA